MLSLCTKLGLCGETQMDGNFVEHMSKYGLSFGTKEEFMFRQELYLAQDKVFSEINANPLHTFTVGHNHLSTWTKEEKKRLLGAKIPTTKAEPTILSEEGLERTRKVDWRKKGAVNAVKNQGHCGSCWAFSATAAIEGHHFIKSGELLSLSEQEMVDCSKENNGCHGGLQSAAMHWVNQNGQALETSYPYTATDNTCQY